MKEFVRVINNTKTEEKGKKTIVMRKYLGDITLEDENKTKYEMSTGLNGVGLMIADQEGNIIGLDNKKFIGYIVNHFQEILDENANNKEESHD